MSKGARNVLFTFDYELFLGSKSGSVIDCLIKPTDRLLELFKKYTLQNAIFFVDTSYLYRLKYIESSACRADLKLIEDQLIHIINNGHYVFPHIHPHWLDAIYIDKVNQWDLSNHSKYRFHNINEKEREVLFAESISILNKLIAKSNRKYDLNSYRAGGWSIQPFSDFKPYFIKYNMKNDFSVVKGFKNLSQAQYMDFINCPLKNIYNFDDEVNVEVSTGQFTEYTISTISRKLTNKLSSLIWEKILWRIGSRSYGDGISMVMTDQDHKNLKEFGSFEKEFLAIELLHAFKLNAYKKFISDNHYTHFISHPKMLSEHNLSTFDRLLRYLTSNFTLQTDFSHISSI